MKEVYIPAFLHDIHGEKSTLFDVGLTYSGGLVSVVTIWMISVHTNIELSWWKHILLLLISADIGAGVVANFTKGTNKHYNGEHKRQSRIIFILTHFIHPSVFFFSTSTFSITSIVLVCLVIAATFLINFIKETEKQGVVAAFLFVCGISLLIMFNISSLFLWWFFPLYMVKLFLAFGIRRYQ